MFKFRLDEEVWYMKDNRIHSANILSRKYIDNVWPKSLRSSETQDKIYAIFGNECIRYSTTHGEYSEHELFSSKEELVEDLIQDLIQEY